MLPSSNPKNPNSDNDNMAITILFARGYTPRCGMTPFQGLGGIIFLISSNPKNLNSDYYNLEWRIWRYQPFLGPCTM
jgi:hypothetical protein